MFSESREAGQPTWTISGGRIEWLDGVRALAAGFVVLHHIWLMSYGGFPDNNGPWPTDWLIYGHLAVSVFIVVSGFSLALAPMKHGLILKDGGTGFIRRRFWRIVPPYWAALALSVGMIAVGLISSPSGEDVTAKDVLVHTLLVQDAIGNTSPNGVFWSIAVEWHIYFLFPVLLFAYRRFGILSVIYGVAILIIGQHIVGSFVPVVGELDRFTPAYLLLFAFGTAAAGQLYRRPNGKMVLLLAGFLVAVFVAALILLDSRMVVGHYFWVDLWVGAATALVFIALGVGKLAVVARFLSIRPLAFIGQYAFSLYLVHALILEIVRTWVVIPLGLTQASAFWAMLALGVPGALAGAYCFFVVFERPFLTIRSFSDLRMAVRHSLVDSRGGRRRNNGQKPQPKKTSVSRQMRSWKL